jgi:hypothetical protein
MPSLCDTASRHALTLLAAAQADGSLRDDFGPADLTALFLANSGIVRTPLHTDAHAWRRHLGFVFDGLRTRVRDSVISSRQDDGNRAGGAHR